MNPEHVPGTNTTPSPTNTKPDVTTTETKSTLSSVTESGSTPDPVTTPVKETAPTTEHVLPTVTALATPLPTLPEIVTVTKKRISRPLIAGIVGFLIPIIGHFLYTTFTKDVVAVVNDVTILQEELDENVALMIKSAALQGLDTEDPAVQAEITSQTLDNLISNAVLMDAAQQAGIVVDPAEVEEAYAGIVAQTGGEEELKKRMEEVGLTEEKLRSNITDRILVDTYVESVTEIENIVITEEDVATYAEELTQSGIVLPPLEEIYSDLEANIRAERQQTLVTELIASLKAAAKIEIKG
jgi:FKBP-type peptidyl-prolyl cis-trans isomerase (trigger factor)